MKSPIYYGGYTIVWFPMEQQYHVFLGLLPIKGFVDTELQAYDIIYKAMEYP